MRITPANVATLDPTALAEFGHLLETVVVGELRKQVAWRDEQDCGRDFRRVSCGS